MHNRRVGFGAVGVLCGIFARLALSTIVAIVFLGDGALADAQTASSTDLAIAALAGRVAVPLEKVKARKVVVADLRGPDGESHPAGGWLADQLSASLQRDFANLGTLDRGFRSAAGRAQKDRDWARSLGAAVVITGTFGKVAGGVRISLAAAGVSGSDRVFIQANGRVKVVVVDRLLFFAAD
jgi:TolB-like protein